MTSCLLLPLLSSVGELILMSLPMSLLSSIIYFSRFLVTQFGLSLIYILYPLRGAFLYVFVTNAPMSFHTLFIRSLVEVHRSSAKSHYLFFPVFIHKILLDLGLEDFPASELIHIIALIGATFLRQRAAQLKASSKRSRVESSIGDASRPLTSNDPTAEEYVDPTAAVGPPPSSSSNSSLQSMLNTVMTV